MGQGNKRIFIARFDELGARNHDYLFILSARNNKEEKKRQKQRNSQLYVSINRHNITKQNTTNEIKVGFDRSL